jgi:hypothetical protein
MLSVCLCPKVITLSGFHCISYYTTNNFNLYQSGLHLTGHGTLFRSECQLKGESILSKQLVVFHYMFFISDDIMPGKKMANNFIIKKGKKSKFQENFFPPGGCKREKKLLRFQRSKNFSEMLFSFYKA